MNYLETTSFSCYSSKRTNATTDIAYEDFIKKNIMQTLLISLMGPQRRHDLQVPGDMTLSDLLPALLELCIPLETDATKEIQTWQLLYQQKPLSLDRSLLDAEVVDGSLLTLQNQEEQMTQPLEPLEATPQYFAPKTVTPGRTSGGIGISWSSEGLANEE